MLPDSKISASRVNLIANINDPNDTKCLNICDLINMVAQMQSTKKYKMTNVKNSVLLFLEITP